MVGAFYCDNASPTSNRTNGRWNTSFDKKRTNTALLRTPSAMPCFVVWGLTALVRRAGDGADHRPHASGVYGMDARHLIPAAWFTA